MCGIAGIVDAGNSEVVSRMADVQSHRGPDDRGVCYFPEERVGLGHRRLSIIDLSPAGRQPMANEDETVWIVFGGEIYNFTELRSELESRGHRFRSSTDTEVIVHQYEEDGIACVERLNGMFAFALLDRRRRKLMLARDRFGIKPLYYYQGNGCFIFASEIKAILASGEYSPDLDRQALHDYFTYLYVPSPQTIFRGVRQVPPAHVLEVDLATKGARLCRYWWLGGSESVDRAGQDHEEVKRRLRGLLAESVRLQQVSDVPVGVLLSGGVDSQILAGLMAEGVSRPIKAFTVVFQGNDCGFYDEREAAREAARRFGAEHHELSVEVDDPLEMLNLVRFFDQPFGNPTSYLMYLISKRTRGEATVALCGVGGDELFAGYPRHRAVALAPWLQWIPPAVRKGMSRLITLAGEGHRGMTLRRARQLLEGLDGDVAGQFLKWTYFLSEQDKARLLRPLEDEAPAPRIRTSDRIVQEYLATSPIDDLGNRMLHLDLQTFLPDNLLEYTDKMSMAVGLEVRVPYLDHRVVEYCFTIPFREKLRGGRSKVILKETFADLLPAGVARTPKKGFNAPLAVWMRGRLDSYFDHHMSRPRVEKLGLLDWVYLQELRHEHRTGRRDTSYELFAIMMFDVWYRTYLLGESVDWRERS